MTDLVSPYARVVRVEDTGDGLDADELDRIFERFYRTDTSRSRDRGGSGIGLTISRALVEAHGGQLWAESRGRGQGASFKVRLPHPA
jgi:signal transduction histidine kinase